MKKYTVSYVKTKQNFVICNLPDYSNDMFKRTKEYALFCVLKNIIQRGSMVRMSQYLTEQFSETEISNECCYLIDKELATWKSTIKGDVDHNDYPAELFFNELIVKSLGSKKFLRNLILPEAWLHDILKTCPDDFIQQQVDFYVPELKLVIEIDGSSHSHFIQNKKDELREKACEREGIKTVRIPAKDIKTHSADLNTTLNEIKQLLFENKSIKNYVKVVKKGIPENMQNLEIIIRLQMLFIELMLNNVIKSGTKYFTVSFDSEIDSEKLADLAQLAYSDLEIWVKNLNGLIKTTIILPQLIIEQKSVKADLHVNFSLYKRYTDEFYNHEDTVYIRNDYYDNKCYYQLANADSITYTFRFDDVVDDTKYFEFILKNVYGYDTFKNGQLNIITNILQRNDTIGILPTGTGKSLCYQIAALLQPGVTLVVVPILSLMYDQKVNLDKIGFDRSTYISSANSGREKGEILRDIGKGKYHIVWISPERFQNAKFRESLGEVNRNFNFAHAVIDEVHCMSEWGHDFRVSYLALIDTIHTVCPETRLLGLTATASQAVLTDLLNEFGITTDDVKALSSMEREELVFRRIIVNSNGEKIEEIHHIIRQLSEKFGQDVTMLDEENTRCGLIFTPTVKGPVGCKGLVDRLCKIEELAGKVGIYNGQLNQNEKMKSQKDFMNNKYAVMACTKAFGMGIDKSNVYYTIHYTLPQSIESFYQEAGRAGRYSDKSQKSYCYILYCPEHINDEDEGKIFDPKTKASERKKLCQEKLSNDLSVLMNLWNNNKEDVDDEYAHIREVLYLLHTGKKRIICDGEQELYIKQNALYKLSVLNIVDSWTVEYLSLTRAVLVVDFKGVNESVIENALISYIRKYDSEFSLSNNNKNYDIYREILVASDKRVGQLIKILLEWSNNNILNQRLQSTYNMMELCSSDVSDEDFRRRIDYYFRYTSESIIFGEIAFNPYEYEKWFMVLYDTDEFDNVQPVTKDNAKNLLASLQRYLESYHLNTGLNYLAGMLRLYVEDHPETEGKQRLLSSFSSIKNFDDIAQQSILKSTLDLASIFTLDSRDVLSEILLEYYPEKRADIFSSLSDHVSLCLQVNDVAMRLSKIMEDMFR